MDSPIVKFGLAAIAILAVSFFIVQAITSDDRPRYGANAYYYDLNTGELFEHDAKAGSPVEAPSGPTDDGEPAGYQAHVVACGDCTDESKRFIAYLKKDGQIRPLDDDQWYDINSDAAYQINQTLDDDCSGGDPLKTCYPPKN